MATLSLIILAIAIAEIMGWPFLAKPAERVLNDMLDRKVSLSAPEQTKPEFKLKLIGGIRLELGYFELASPEWSKAPHMLQGKNVTLALNYGDLLKWRKDTSSAFRVETLKAESLDGYIERLADGRASWQFSTEPVEEKEPAPIPEFGLLAIESGVIRYQDAPLALNLNATLSLQESEENANVLKVNAEGNYQKNPLLVKLVSNGVLPWVAKDVEPIPIVLDATLGGAKLAFKGEASDALQFQALSGHFVLSGASLANVGEALGITLPTTPAFRTEGDLSRDAELWKASIASAQIGNSKLNGEFIYDGGQSPALLSGTLKGSSLALADLGPAVGAQTGGQSDKNNQTDKKPDDQTENKEIETSADPTGANDASNDTSASDSKAGAREAVVDAKTGKVLPNKQFDLPSLRAMNADVAIDIDNLDLGSDILKPLKPLRAHLVLDDGVLSIKDIDARTAQGNLAGAAQLDGRKNIAIWTTDLKWEGVQLDQWLDLKRTGEQPPYVTGKMNGFAKLEGKGKSTAEILGSLSGNVRTQVQNGSMSHLIIEAAGLDVAQALSVWVKGDDVLDLNCAVADLQAKEGVLRPRVFVIDTQDSSLWVDGNISMKTEEMDLKVVVSPKDFSPVSLRTPLLVSGTMGSPNIALEKGPLVGKVAGAALLSLVSPVAALLPFIEAGSPDSATDEARKSGSGCQNLAARFNRR